MNAFLNNIQFFILLFILGGSFSTWLFGKLREKRELKVMRDAERRRKEELLRTGRSSEVPTAAQGATPGGARDSEAMRALAEKRQAQIRALRERKGGQQQTGTLGGPPRATPSGSSTATRSGGGNAGRSSGGGSGGASVAARNQELARRREEMLRAIRERQGGQGEPKKPAVSRPQEASAASRASEARPAPKVERSPYSPAEKLAAPIERPRPVVAIEAEAAPRRTSSPLMPVALPKAPSTSVLVRGLLKPKPGERTDRMTLGAIYAATEVLGKPVSLREQHPGS